MKRFDVFLVFFFVFGCATYTMVEPKRVNISTAFSVEPRP